MDKHMTAFALIEDGVICVCHSETPCECALGCKRYVLVDLSRLASLESLAAKVPDLERDVRHILHLLQLVCRDHEFKENQMPCYGEACEPCEIGKWIRAH